MTALLPRCATSLLACLSLLVPAAAQQSDWTGWLYLEDGDVPIRMHLVEGDARTPGATIDLPAAGSLGVEFGAILADDSLRLVHPPGAQEPSIELSLPIGPDASRAEHLEGAVDWQGTRGAVEFHRTASSIVWHDPAETTGIVGTYGRADGSGRAVYAQSWGELVLVQPATGAQRTLFARPDGSFVVGPALYVAAPVERVLRFERDDDGNVAALVDEVAGVVERFPRRTVESLELRVESDGVALVGTLTLAGQDSPCVVVAGGSGWGRREGLVHIAAILSSYGISSVVYDQRGFGASAGDRVVAFATTAADLRAFADAARSTAGIDPDRVGYLGASRGAWYGSLAAAADTRAAFFISMVGPAVSPIEQETTARLARMDERGATDEDLALARHYLRAMWRFARNGEGGDEYLRLHAVVEAAGWLDPLGGPASLAPQDWLWWRLNGEFDPRSTLRSLRCPVLALFGELDVAVSAAVNAPLMRDAVWASESDVVAVEVLPGCDHGPRPVIVEEGRPLPFHRSPGWHPDLWSTIGAFVRANR